MIKNIVFDWSGVINDNFELVYNVAMAMFIEFGTEKISVEEFREEFVLPYMIFYNKYMPNLSLKDEQEAYVRLYKKLSLQYPSDAYPNIKETLIKFKDSGINMNIISSDHKITALKEMERFEMQDMFKSIIIGVLDKSESIKKVIRDNSYNPKETIFIGDMEHEIEAGKKAGTLTAGVTWGFNTEDKLRSANPDYIIHNLEELEQIILGK